MPVAEPRSAARQLKRRSGERGKRLRHAWGASVPNLCRPGPTIDTASDDA